MKVGVAGQGAFGIKHLEGIQNIPGIEVITLTGGNQAATEEVAKRFKIPHFTGDLGESLKQPGLEAMILATPTQMHAAQGEQVLRAGKHVQVEIPIADSLADSERLVKAQKESGVIAMGGRDVFAEAACSPSVSNSLIPNPSTTASGATREYSATPA